MVWGEFVEEAKEELGYSQGEWIEDFGEVIDLAKKNYWESESFEELKEDTISEGGGECLICSIERGLTAHHITYGNNAKTICVCNDCHGFIHEVQKKWGFVMQCVLIHFNDFETIEHRFPGMYNVCLSCYNELIEKVKNE